MHRWKTNESTVMPSSVGAPSAGLTVPAASGSGSGSGSACLASALCASWICSLVFARSERGPRRDCVLLKVHSMPMPMQRLQGGVCVHRTLRILQASHDLVPIFLCFGLGDVAILSACLSHPQSAVCCPCGVSDGSKFQFMDGKSGERSSACHRIRLGSSSG